MSKWKLIVSFLLCCILVLHAESISITGTVKKTGTTTGLAGVKISLAKIPAVTTTTDASGAFTLTGSTSVTAQTAPTSQLQFAFKGNVITFTAASGDVTGRLEIFSGNGKRISAVDIKTQNTAAVTLPDLSPGLSIMQLTIGNERFTRTIMTVGNDMFFYNGKNDLRTAGAFTLTKQATAAPIDTLVAAKDGFTTKKVPIDGYTKQGVAIEMDSGAGTGGKCTREALQAVVDSYIAALEAADPTKMDLATGAKYIENLKSSSIESGIWKTKIKVNFHRDFFDVDSCKIYTEIVDNVSSTPYNIGAQITVKEGKITEISALVATIGDWLLKDAKSFTSLYTQTKGETWSIIPAEKRNDRKTIQAAGDAYLDFFLDSTIIDVPWGIPCVRLEGGAVTGSGPKSTCNVGVPQNVKITNRIYVVDVEMGTVDIFCKFGGSMPDSHLFRVEDGKIRYVHTISIN